MMRERFLFVCTLVVLFASCTYEDIPQIKSRYYKDVSINYIEPSFFECNKVFNIPFTFYSRTADVYFAFDSLTNIYPNKVLKHYVGEACDGQLIYAYEMLPEYEDAPLFFVIAGQHGTEKSDTFGLLLFLQTVLEGNDVLSSFLKSLHYVIIPIANPSGFDARTYRNANKVNLNRNWGVIGWKAITDDINSSDYPGLVPFDQPETYSISSFIKQFSSIFMFLDYHTQGSGCIANASNINWIGIPRVDDDSYYALLYKATENHLNSLTTHFIKKYGKEALGVIENQRCGRIEKCSYYRDKGCANNYMAQQDVLSVTFEGVAGFPGDTLSHTDRIYQANCEMFANYILQVCAEYSDSN